MLLYELSSDEYCYSVCATAGTKQRVVHADPAINFAIGKRLDWLLSRFSEGKLKLIDVLEDPAAPSSQEPTAAPSQGPEGR